MSAIGHISLGFTAMTVGIVTAVVGLGYAVIYYLGPGLPTQIGSAAPSPIVISPPVLIVGGLLFFGGLVLAFIPWPRGSAFADFWDGIDRSSQYWEKR